MEQIDWKRLKQVADELRHYAARADQVDAIDAAEAVKALDRLLEARN